MIVAAHQPCYFPPISFFRKLAQADVFLLADDYQFSKHQEFNRARIKTAQGAAWMTVPVRQKGLHGQAIRDVRIENTAGWRKKHERTIRVNYTYAAYYEQYADEVAALYRRSYPYLIELNLATLELLRRAFGLETALRLSSELGCTTRGDDKLLELLQALGCTIYLAGPELKGYLQSRLFERHGIKLVYLQGDVEPYHQLFGEFVPGLSALDLLLNEGAEGRRLLGG